MSNLEELIEKLCPDGVEYKTIRDICKKIASGGTPTASKSEYYNGYIPWLRTQEVDWKDILDTEIKITELGYNNSSTKWIPKNCVIVAMYGATAAKVAINKIPLTTNQACCNLEIDERIAEYKYVYYWLCKEYINLKSLGQGSQHNINANIIKNYKLPVPPLEVQREIVRILDNFTFLTTELAAELAARQKQYEYYKEYLFENHIFDVEWKRLDELFPFIRNGFVGTIKSFFTNETDGIRYLEGTNIHDGVISDNEVLYVTKEFHKKHIKNQLKADDILMVQSGHIGECAVVGKKYEGSNCHALIIMSNGGKCLSKYYVYYFHTIKGFKSLTPAITGGTIKHVLAGKIGKIKVPVPSLEQQQRIVDILDRFDTLCNDITSGLPAEIEMRQKQYEYYRDKLLTFKELKKEA